MATVIRVQATVQPGGKIEVTDPTLLLGQPVEVVVTVTEAVPVWTRSPEMGVYDWPADFRERSRCEEARTQFEGAKPGMLIPVPAKSVLTRALTGSVVWPARICDCTDRYWF
jgi:hypothetical protein